MIFVSKRYIKKGTVRSEQASLSQLCEHHNPADSTEGRFDNLEQCFCYEQGSGDGQGPMCKTNPELNNSNGQTHKGRSRQIKGKSAVKARLRTDADTKSVLARLLDY